ncbi:MAG: hypothetical protein JWM83_129 [Candidatus Angelobacter sp.]|nr:hypothetical protein [Candidatus Angelobacter sp.]
MIRKQPKLQGLAQGLKVPSKVFYENMNEKDRNK